MGLKLEESSDEYSKWSQEKGSSGSTELETARSGVNQDAEANLKIRTAAAAIYEILSNNYETKLELGIEYGESAKIAIQFFSDYLAITSLENNDFWQDPTAFLEEKKEFADKFARFTDKLNRAMLVAEGDVRRYADHSNFNIGWQKRVRVAAYLAFFFHYANYRRSEYTIVNGTKKPKDYVEHVFAVCFNEILKKAVALSERAFIGALLHDVVEDSNKLFAAHLHNANSVEHAKSVLAGNPKGANEEYVEQYNQVQDKMSDLKEKINVRKMISRIFLDPPGPTGDLKKRDANLMDLLLNVLDKGETKDRHLALVELFQRLCQNFQIVKETYGIKIAVQFFCEALWIKFGDRLQNLRTLCANFNDEVVPIKERQKVIQDESIFNYREIMHYFKCINLRGHADDYLALAKNPLLRRAVSKSEIRLNRRERRQVQISLATNTDNQYSIVVRSNPLRYKADVLEQESDQQEIDAKCVLLCIPTERLVDQASFDDSFRRLFPTEIKPQDLSGESNKFLDSDFFTRLRELETEQKLRIRVARHEGNLRYGNVVAVEFFDQAAAFAGLGGDLHSAYFHDDESAIKKIEDFVENFSLETRCQLDLHSKLSKQERTLEQNKALDLLAITTAIRTLNRQDYHNNEPEIDWIDWLEIRDRLSIIALNTDTNDHDLSNEYLASVETLINAIREDVISH